MDRYLTFYKTEEGRWYVSLPEWEDSIDYLEMVAGADVLLDIIANNHFDGADFVTIRVLTHPHDFTDGRSRYTLKRKKVEGLESGKIYWVFNEYLEAFDIWLCDVTKFVFNGKFPKTIYFEV